MLGTMTAWAAVAVVGGTLVLGGCADSMSGGAMSGRDTTNSGDTMTGDEGMAKKDGMAGDKAMMPEKK